MSLLWTPEQTPPQVTEDASQAVIETLLEDGALKVTLKEAASLIHRDELLGSYVHNLGVKLCDDQEDGDWPLRALKIGAATAHFAYRKSGFFQSVTPQALEAGGAQAAQQGIAESYVASYYEDPQLVQIIALVTDGINFYDEHAGYAKAIDIGAGCTRYYLQQSLAAS